VGVNFRADKIIDPAIAYNTEWLESTIGSMSTSNGALSSGASGDGSCYEGRLRV